MHIYLNASEIASLINKNKYNSQEDAIHDVLCRIKKEKNNNDLNKLTAINKNELLELLELFTKKKLINEENYKTYKNTLINTNETNITQISKNILDNVSETAINTKNTNNSKKIENSIKTNIKNVVKNKNITLVENYINGHINKNRGIVNENKIINIYEKKNNIKIKENNSKLYKMKLFTIDIYNIYICGKIDGIIDNTLIEIKNRRNRLFEFIPVYEQIQTEIYFRLTNLENGKLIQNYNNTTSEFLIYKNDELWSSIKNDIFKVCNNIIEKL